MVTKYVTLDEKRKGLSKKESYLLSYLAENRKSIFVLGDVVEVLDCSYENAKVIVERLAKKKWIVRIIKGKYLIVPLIAGIKGEYTEHEFIIASLFEPCYIAYWTALNYYGFTEQVPNKIFVAIRKRTNDREILGTKFKFVYISEKKFFGFNDISISNVSVRISDKEKTIVDCLDKPKYCGGIEEITKAIFFAKEEIDFGKLTNYAIKIGNNAVIKRLGFILDFLGVNSKNLKNKISDSYSILDPTKVKTGKYDSKWKVLVNVSEEELKW
ncbi:MAG: type IV toxin-antitoxin system AbiEi family antitoxin [Candidatus Thermoplasmatota archaeon]|nr:type IV toxin-antitoxin system AbiEi family antitoxin [Candidatus Thermoplasmatota archaeon]